MATVNYGDTDAWILLYTTYGGNTHNLYLKTGEQPRISDIDRSAFAQDQPSRGHFGFTLNSETVPIKITKVYAETKAEWDEVKTGIKAIKASTEVVYFRLQIASTPAYEAFDGTNTLMPVIIFDIKDKRKVYNGDTTIWEIGLILLRQTGALAA